MEQPYRFPKQRWRPPANWNTRKIGRAVITLAILALAVFLLIHYIQYILPFVLAGLIMLVLEPVVSFLVKKIRIPRIFASMVTLLLFALLAIALLAWISVTMVSELLNITRSLPSVSQLVSIANDYLDAWRVYFESIPPDVLSILSNALEQNVQRFATSFNTGLTQMVTTALVGIRGMIARLPSFFLVLVITMVAAFFMSRDRVKISRFFERQMPDSGRETFIKLKHGMFAAVIGVLRAQVSISIINGCIVFVGYSIIGLPFPLLISLFTAVVDVLPVLGVGTVLVPWSLISFATGNVRTGVVLALTYCVTFVLRQFLEPRLMGKGLGLHPLVTMMAMYIGLRAGGVLGLFTAPLLVAFLKALQEADLLPRFRNDEDVYNTPRLDQPASQNASDKQNKQDEQPVQNDDKNAE